ncbi:chemotaxis protein CheW [Spirulina sp. 06S082]|uniref:chemotaxis protein CheW n=1 Tax=Spirulina sp. 06S082 TaxID=3110248 RepID=UPI002B21D42C|nr:chemotaxis protein CheW [Spirulina sp. 06S082]MEA5472573.1 chemotaxis protein CheW [Spirulina sp. 06S082]
MSNTIQEPQTVRVIIFSVLHYLFALPLKAILKIIPRPPELDEGFDDAGLLEIEGETVLLLNLIWILEEWESGDRSPRSGKYLILIRNNQGQLCGIEIDELPTTLDLPRAIVQELPSSSRQANLGRLAQYVALWQSEEEDSLDKKPIFLLDVSMTTHSLLYPKS